MKTAALFILALLPGICRADTFLLKDGTRLEGAVTGEMEGAVLIKTAYGSLTINRADISEQVAAKPAAAESPAASTATAAEAPPAELPAAELPAADPALPEPAQDGPAAPLTFTSLSGENGERLVVYYEGGVAVATETYDAGGALLSLQGAVKNGTYSEFHPGGALKSVKTMLGGRANGSVKTYYPDGKPQIEAYYFDGAKDGDFKYFGEDGLPLLEAAYKADKLHGWKREYGPGGAKVSELYYQDDRPAEPPKPPAPPSAGAPGGQDPESLVTAKAKRISRGEIFSFKLGGKYIGKVRVDTEFNVIEQDGDIPDGGIKVYSKDGKLQKELVFKGGELKVLRAYEEGGRLRAVYTYRENKASSFAVK